MFGHRLRFCLMSEVVLFKILLKKHNKLSDYNAYLNYMNKITYLTLMFFAILSCKGEPSTSQKQSVDDPFFIADIGATDIIKMKSGDLSQYLTDGQASFGNVRIEKSGAHFYLHTSDNTTNDIYATQLREVDNRLYLDLKAQVHSCSKVGDIPCKFLKNTNYTIVGCTGQCDHNVSVKS